MRKGIQGAVRLPNTLVPNSLIGGGFRPAQNPRPALCTHAATSWHRLHPAASEAASERTGLLTVCRQSSHRSCFRFRLPPSCFLAQSAHQRRHHGRSSGYLCGTHNDPGRAQETAKQTSQRRITPAADHRCNCWVEYLRDRPDAPILWRFHRADLAHHVPAGVWVQVSARNQSPAAYNRGDATATSERAWRLAKQDHQESATPGPIPGDKTSCCARQAPQLL